MVYSKRDYLIFSLSKVVTFVFALGNSPGGGGVLSGKVGTGMCGPDRVLFRALRFCNARV